jgi:hypothetical protein
LRSRRGFVVNRRCVYLFAKRARYNSFRRGFFGGEAPIQMVNKLASDDSIDVAGPIVRYSERLAVNHLRCSSATAEAGTDAEHVHLLRHVPEGEFLMCKCRCGAPMSAIEVTPLPAQLANGN